MPWSGDPKIPRLLGHLKALPNPPTETHKSLIRLQDVVPDLTVARLDPGTGEEIETHLLFPLHFACPISMCTLFSERRVEQKLGGFEDETSAKARLKRTKLLATRRERWPLRRRLRVRVPSREAYKK